MRRDNKTIRKTIRFDEYEYAYITKQIEEHHLSFAELGRAAILNQKIKSKLELEMVFQVSKIGINLNQLAYHVNTKKCIDMEVLYRLVQIEKSLIGLLNGG